MFAGERDVHTTSFKLAMVFYKNDKQSRTVSAKQHPDLARILGA